MSSLLALSVLERLTPELLVRVRQQMESARQPARLGRDLAGMELGARERGATDEQIALASALVLVLSGSFPPASAELQASGGLGQ